MGKKLLSFEAVFIMIIALFFALPAMKADAATIVDSGTCGDNLTWTFNDEGTLTISGTGAMEDYDGYDNYAPWSDFSYDIYNVIIGDEVTSIGDGAFSACWSLTSISIPNSIISIGENAFWDCEALTSINIPGNVIFIGDGAFDGCRELSNISVSVNNKNYSSIDGVMFNKNETELIRCPQSNGCFYGFIPDSVTSIGDGAFGGCYSLESITIPNSITSIGDGAFRDCDSLESITIPNSVTFIGDGAFGGCDSLESITIPNSVTSIGDGAFGGCDSLESITIPNSVTSIGDGAFEWCSSLESITIPNGVISIGDGAFEWCWSLIDITIPNSVISIGDNAFGYCDSLESITIPNSVTFIGNGAFYSCNSLKSITIPNSVTSIGNSTFGYCDSLEDIAIPYSVTSIGDSAFEWCDALTDVYYSGEQSDWEKIKIGNNNVRLIYVQLHCIIPATIAVQPTNAIAGNGEKVSTKITAVGDELTYQWYTCEPGKTTFSKSSVTRSTYEATMTAAKSGRKVYCIVTDKYGNTVKSKEVTLSLLEITQQPVSAEALNGELVSVTIEAQGDDVTYQWWIKNKGDSVYTKSSITTDTYSAVMDESRDGRIIRCVVKDKYGNLVRSDIVTISMKAPAELKITQQPKSASAANGEYVSVTVKAQGDGVTYQWWIKNKGDSSYTKSSITSGTYTTNMTEAKDGRILRCVIKDKYGNLVRSDIVTISMEAPAELKITQQPVSASAANGEYVSVTVKAQGDGVTYQWWIKNPGDSSYTKSSIKSDTYTTNMTEAKDGRILRCVIKDKYGNLVRSDIVTITMS